MKKIKILVITLILILSGVLFGTTYAEEAKTRTLADQIDRPFNEPSIYKYIVPEDSEYTVVKIYDKEDKDDQGKLKYSKVFYCLRGGIGFGSSDTTGTEVEYTEVGEMHQNAKTVIDRYKAIMEESYKSKQSEMQTEGLEVAQAGEIEKTLDRTVTFSIKRDETSEESEKEYEVNLYNAILWIIDEIYLPNDITNDEGQKVYVAEEYRHELLNKAGIPTSQQDEITDNDIEVIQQLALWYFTNYDEQEAEINPTVSQKTMFPAQFLNVRKAIKTEDNASATEGDEINLEDTRENNMNRLYQYLVYGAIENADTYTIGTEEENVRDKYVGENKFDKTSQLTITSHSVAGGVYDYYEIGPIKFSNNVNVREIEVDASDIVLYDAQKNLIPKYFQINEEVEEPESPDQARNRIAGMHVIYKFLDKDNNEVTTLKNGQEYKIRIYKAFEKDSTVVIPNFEEGFDMSEFTIKINSSYKLTKATFLTSGNSSQPVVEIEKEKISNGDEFFTQKPKEFDLSLRKFISSVERNGENVEIEDRTPSIELSDLNKEDRNVKTTTARYVHPKNTISLKRGDIITYTIRVYNEGEVDGKATLVTDYLPEGLELVDGENDIWKVDESDSRRISTDALKDKVIKAYDTTKTGQTSEDGWQKASDGDTGLYYYDLKVVCRIKNDVEDGKVLKNVAEISEDKDSEDNDVTDRDSIPGNVYDDDTHNPKPEQNGYTPGEEDDDDFESVKVEPDRVFDLSLRKYISSIKRNGKDVEFADRTPKINTETLIYGTFDRNGNKEYTATYEHSKEPLVVKKGDVITYTLRVYNEGELDGFASEITDYIPEGLALILNYNTNFENGWKLPNDLDNSKIMKLVGEDGFYKTEEDVKNLKLEDFSDTSSLNEVQLVTGEVSITTTELNDQLIKAFDKNKTSAEAGWQKAETGNGGLYYKDVQVSCLVVAENTFKGTIKNIAEISEDKNEAGEDVDDRDSIPNDKKDPYDKWQEDDDDYEPVILKYFDLALRKFITGVETNGKMEDVTSRIPTPKVGEDGNLVYEHDKDPVSVANNDVVIYTLRVYNEGTQEGYAEEITDDIPEGLEYLPEHETNKKYGWKMYDAEGKETTSIEEAETIKTDYLSEAKGKAEGRDNLLKAYDSSKGISMEEPYNPDYRDIQIAFRVEEPNTSDRIITNKAQITEDSDDDEDSDPHKWEEGEDDQDEEHIYVKYFDLSLLKWVTKTIVTVDGKTTTTATGFKPNQGLTETTDGVRKNSENEPVAKVEIDKKKIDQTTVKFVYTIRVTNEGEIAGYATEITDFIPEGLEFKEEDNKANGWVKKGDKEVTTRALETKLLKPGESAEVEIVFTWKKDKNNLGIKTNIAEITEDYNEHNSKDIDSTPKNKTNPYEKEQEDDDDFALVILSLKTGKGTSYALLITIVTAVLAGGIYLIKKYVFRY